MTLALDQSPCPRCGAVVPDTDRPVHEYVPAAPGCWQLFGEVQADELQRFGYPPTHPLIVDAYMAQHPGDGHDRRDRQSVFVHLCGLYARLELEVPASCATDILRRVVAVHEEFPVLTRARGPGELTVLHVVDALDRTAYEARALEWAHAVWQTWTAEHVLIATAVRALTRR